jgi:hypothetical protein
MTLPTDYVDGDVLTAADVNAITVAVNSNTSGKLAVGTFNAKGDLLVGLTNDSVGILSVGTNGYLLSASSGATSGLSWVPAGGKVLGFASDTDTTQRTTTSTTYVDITGLSVSYTPISATSTLILDMYVTAQVYLSSSTASNRTGRVRILETGGSGVAGEFGTLYPAATGDIDGEYHPIHIRAIYASTGTTSRTFKGQFQANVAEVTVAVNNNIGTGLITVMEVA